VFNHPNITEVIHTTLPYGDYRAEFIDGYRPPFVFERKGLGDLFGSLSKGYKRLKKRINQAIDDNVVFIIIIEASLTKIGKGYKHSSRGGNEIIQQLFTLMIKHKIPFVCCSNATEMSNWIAEFYSALGREKIRKEKENGRKNMSDTKQ